MRGGIKTIHDMIANTSSIYVHLRKAHTSFENHLTQLLLHPL